MTAEQSPNMLKTYVGILIGIALTLIFQGWSQEDNPLDSTAARYNTGPIVKLAEVDLFNSQNSMTKRRRAMAVLLANRPEIFEDIDESLDNRFFDAFIASYDPQNPSLLVADVSNNLLDKSNTVLQEQIGVQAIPEHRLQRMNKRVNEMLAASFLEPISVNRIRRSIIQNRFPNASDEVVEFLQEHPELLSQSLVLQD